MHLVFHDVMHFVQISDVLKFIIAIGRNATMEINYRFTTKDDIDVLMNLRLEMLKVVNNLSVDYKFDESFVSNIRKYFLEGNQSSVIAFCNGKAIGCASMSYIEVMPTFDHPTGNRGHLMNVYTNPNYQRQGIAFKMVTMLIEEARQKGATEISLDATEKGKPLYEFLGFGYNSSGMNINL